MLSKNKTLPSNLSSKRSSDESLRITPCAMVLIDELQEEYLRQLELVGGYYLLKDVLQVMKEKNQIIYGERRVYD